MTRSTSAALLLSLAIVPACANQSDCEAAQDKLNRCEAEKPPPPPSLASYQAFPLRLTGECSGLNACAATCVNNSNCDAIDWLTETGGVASSDPNRAPVPVGGGELNICVQKCIALREQQGH